MQHRARFGELLSRMVPLSGHDVEEIDVVDMQLKDSTLVSEEEKQRALQAARELEGKEPGHHKGGV